MKNTGLRHSYNFLLYAKQVIICIIIQKGQKHSSTHSEIIYSEPYGAIKVLFVHFEDGQMTN